jgi:molecular chaperone GrpE
MFWWGKKDDKKEENLKDLEQEIENLENNENIDNNDIDNKDKPEDGFEEKYNILNDKYLRLIAEFENFKRRSTDEKIQNFNIWWKEVLASVVPFLDNFKRAIDSCEDELKENNWVKWILAVELNLIWDLEKIWFAKIKAEWERINFKKHEALMQDSNVEKDMVAQVLEDWYEYNWEVVRVAKVSVWSK